MINYKNLPQERKEEYNRRVQKILDSHKSMSEFPESWWRQLRLSTAISTIRTMLRIEEYYGNKILNDPFVRFGRLFMGLPEIPEEMKVSKSVKSVASDALIEAAALGQTEMCRWLIKDLKANVNARDSEKRTPLCHAIRRKRLGTASYLMDQDASVDVPKENFSPVLTACVEGCVPALNMFKYHKIDFNKGYEYIVRESKFSWPTKRIMYPLEAACLGRQNRAVRWLLDNDVDVNIFNPSVGIYTIHRLVKEADFSDFLDPETKAILKSRLRPIPPRSPAPQQGLMQRARRLFQR